MKAYGFNLCCRLGVCIDVNFILAYVTIGSYISRVSTNYTFEPVHEISNNVVCATSKASDQPAHMRSLIRAFASHLSILRFLSY